MSTVIERDSAAVLHQQFGARQMVTLSEGEAFLGISHSTMKNLIRDRKIHSVKIGGSRRIPVDSLLEVATRGTNE